MFLDEGWLRKASGSGLTFRLVLSLCACLSLSTGSYCILIWIYVNWSCCVCWFGLAAIFIKINNNLLLINNNSRLLTHWPQLPIVPITSWLNWWDRQQPPLSAHVVCPVAQSVAHYSHPVWVGLDNWSLSEHTHLQRGPLVALVGCQYFAPFVVEGVVAPELIHFKSTCVW